MGKRKAAEDKAAKEVDEDYDGEEAALSEEEEKPKPKRASKKDVPQEPHVYEDWNVEPPSFMWR